MFDFYSVQFPFLVGKIIVWLVFMEFWQSKISVKDVFLWANTCWGVLTIC